MTAHPLIAPEKPWLAPLAGWTDLPFRLLCRERGAAVTCTEMISAKGVVYEARGKAKNTETYLKTAPEDAPLVAQLFGAEPEFLAEAARILKDRGFEWFDLNAGCSVRKVVKTGAGAALLKEPDRLAACVKAIADVAGPGRAGVKTRLGWSPTAEGPGAAGALGPKLEDAGASWIALHPRYAVQGFSGRAESEGIRALKATASIPVIASGDLFTAEDGLRAVREAGADGVMFARGAMHDPAIFTRYLALLGAAGTLKSLPDDGPGLAALLARHADLIETYGEPRQALLRMRSVMPRYLRGITDAKAARSAIISCRGFEDLRAVIAKVRDSLPAAPETHGDAMRNSPGNARIECA